MMSQKVPEGYAIEGHVRLVTLVGAPMELFSSTSTLPYKAKDCFRRFLHGFRNDMTVNILF